MSHSFKQLAPTDHFGWHAAYLEVYERLFRTVDHGSVLEIGCDGGGGILSYEDFFSQLGGMMLPRQFVSCDVSPEPESLRQHKSVMRTFYQMDAYSVAALNVLQKHAPFSVIVDDGPHSIESQSKFLNWYPLMLSNRGIAIVEDIQDPAHVESLFRALPGGFTGYSVDLRLADNRYDSLLFVAHRR